MIKRTVDISERAYIRTQNNQLLIEKSGELAAVIPVEDIGILILQHPAIVITQKTLIVCQKNNTVVVFCDEQYIPYSVILPISEGHSLHTKVLQQQISVSKSTKNRLWQQIVRHKIIQQVDTLDRLNVSSATLKRIAIKVKSSDKENHEAQAAQLYWRLLMGQNFRRDRNQSGINALLNYGYAIIRAMVARSLVGSGLHPALGLHHHNQYNGLCLADDLMEPFRPWVDLVVWKIARQDSEPKICKNNKRYLLELLSNAVIWKDQPLPLMVASHHLMANLKSVMFGATKALNIPTRIKEDQ